MTDVNLTPVNCAGDTCHMRLGRDPGSADPSALRGALFHDDTIDCDAGGVFVNRCNPAVDLDAAQLPVDVDNGNLLRKVEDCGLIVVAPLLRTEGGGTQQDIPGDGSQSASSKQFTYTNNDLVDQLVTLTARVWVRGHKTSASATSCLLRAAYRTISSLPSLEGVTQADVHLTLAFDDLNGQLLDDRRYLPQMWIVEPGQTLVVDYHLGTLDRVNFLGDNADNEGFQVVNLVSRIEQVRSN